MTGGERKEGDGEKGEGERRKSDVRSAERMRKSHEFYFTLPGLEGV